MVEGDNLEIIASRKAPNLHKNGVECFAISSSGNNLVTSAARAKAKSQAFKLWTGNVEEIIKLKQPHMNVVQGVVFSPTSDDTFYSFANDCSVKVWSFSKKACTATIEGAHYASISSLSFSRDGRYFLTTAMDNSLTMWNASTNKRRASCDAGEILSDAVFCGENDERIVTLGRAGGVKVWDETNTDRSLVDDDENKKSTVDETPAVKVQDAAPQLSTYDPAQHQQAEQPSPRMSFNILNKMTSAFRSSSKSFDSTVTASPKTPQSSPIGMPLPPKGLPSLSRSSLTGAVPVPGMGAAPVMGLGEGQDGDGASISTLDGASYMELEMAQNQAVFISSKNKKLEEQLEALKAQLYAKDVELRRKQDELNTANLQCSQIGQQWQTYTDNAVNETASRWRSHSEAIEAEKQNEIYANSSIREEVEKLREEYGRFKEEKEIILSEK